MQLLNLRWPNLQWVRRLLAYLLLVCTASGAVGQSEQPVDPPLDAPALAMQMLLLHPHLDLNRYALGYLQFESPLQYNSILHDKAALKKTLDALTEKLASERASGKKLPELRLDTIGEVIKLKGERTVTLSSLLSSGAIPINNNERVFEGFLPSSFLTLFPNASLAGDTAITPEFARYVADRLQNQDRTPVYISAYFRAVRFQQSNVAQTYLTRVKFYTDAERTKLLQEKIEKRNGPALVARTLLVDGLTLNANADHSTVINGEYMLEFFPAAGWEQQHCQPQNPVRGHRVWLCRRDLPKIEGEAIERAEHLYLGGRLVQIAFVNVKAAPITDINEIKQSMTERYGGVFNEKQTQYQWQQQSTFYQADFSMLKNGKKPYLVIRAAEYQALLDGKPGYEPVP